jgi:hypothetical protein
VTIRPAPGKTTPPTHLPVAQAGLRRTSRPPRPGAPFAEPYPLGASALRVLRALIHALCPPAPAPRSSEILSRVELGARRLLRYMHPTVARALAVGLVVLDYLPVLTLASRFRLHRLEGARAGELVARWAKSPFLGLRLLIQGARSLVLGVYFDQKEVHTALRYEPVAFIDARVRLRNSLLRPVPAAAAE